MSTFEASRGIYDQEHFTVVEIDLPVVNGACTIGAEPGFGTPLSCDQPSDGTKTYKFTNTDINLGESHIWKCISTISEQTAKLQSGRGLASRGTASITFTDFINQDPNPNAPAVTAEVKAQGTFFGKLFSRQIFANKEVRIKNYRVEADGTIDLVNGAQTRYYISESLDSNKNGSWALKCKDELSRINDGDSVWPLPLEGLVRTDVNDTALTIDVDPNVTYLVGDTVRIGDELIKISSVANIGTGTATISTAARGANIIYTNTLSRTVKDSHTAGDEIFVCDVSDNERIDTLLQRVLIDIGVPTARIPIADWITEIDAWHATTRVNTVWIESEDSEDVLRRILTEYMIDMWFDPVDREVKISAISVWKESDVTLTESKELDFLSISRKRQESLRATRALIAYDKRFLASADSIENYKKASQFKRTEFEGTDLFGEPKTIQFDNSFLIDKDSADLLVNRYVNRYINPFSFSAIASERKVTYKVGDVINLVASSTPGFDGLPSSTERGQITRINPIYGRVGRTYAIDIGTYAPVFASGSEVVITGNLFNVNLYTQYAGAPNVAVTITFIFNGVLSGSTADNIQSIRAGAFPAGSKIIIILANGADLQAKGGNSVKGGGAEFDPESDQWFTTTPGDSKNGAVVYDAMGIDTDIYFSGATPSAAFPVADGFIRAPSGGDGGFNANISIPKGGNSGNAGSGRPVGIAGSGGTIRGAATGDDGDIGNNGTESGPFGLDGVDNDATAGLKGSGVVDNGATVVFFGSTATRYVNGNGDH